MKTKMKTLERKRIVCRGLLLVPVLMLTLAFLSASCSKEGITEKEELTKKEELNKVDYSGHPILGRWFIGSISGGRYNTVTGRYEGASGIGVMYFYEKDGSYAEIIVNNLPYGGTWSAYVSGQYRLKDNKITYSKSVSEESNDDGKTWSKKKSLPDHTDYVEFGTDEVGKYMLVGLDGATPPLDPETNAAKYRFAGKD